MFKTEATLNTITFVNQANTFVFFRKILEILPYFTFFWPTILVVVVKLNYNN